MRLRTFFVSSQSLGTTSARKCTKRLVAGALAEPFDQPVEVTLLLVDKPHLHGHVLTQDAVEADFALRFGQEIDLEIEELRDGLVTSKAGQEQDVFAKWRRNCERPVRLCVRRHALTPNSCPECRAYSNFSQPA